MVIRFLQLHIGHYYFKYNICVPITVIKSGGMFNVLPAKGFLNASTAVIMYTSRYAWSVKPLKILFTIKQIRSGQLFAKNQSNNFMNNFAKCSYILPTAFKEFNPYILQF